MLAVLLMRFAQVELRSKEWKDGWGTIRGVEWGIGQDVREGRIVLNPMLVSYLEREGVYWPGAWMQGPA